MYMRDGAGPSLQEEKGFIDITSVHKTARMKKPDTTWSADFVQGKGEGLTFLLHGKPGVGKTYTAGQLTCNVWCEFRLTGLRMHRGLYRPASTVFDVC